MMSIYDVYYEDDNEEKGRELSISIPLLLLLGNSESDGALSARSSRSSMWSRFPVR